MQVSLGNEQIGHKLFVDKHVLLFASSELSVKLIQTVFLDIYAIFSGIYKLPQRINKYYGKTR